MKPEAKALLFDVKSAASLIVDFTKGRDFGGFSSDRMLQSAVERQFEVIGEALNRLTKVDLETAQTIPDFRRMIAFRNRLIHGYDGISLEVVWDVVETKLPYLLHKVEDLLEPS